MTDPEVVFVTGSRSGIGRHLVEHFLASNKTVVGCSRTAPDWTADGYRHLIGDVAVEADVKAMIACIQREFGRLDVVINNAGVASMNHSLLTSVATVDRLMATNFRGTFLVCREGARVMSRRKYGRIVNVASVAVPLQLEGELAYAASKSAVVTLTRILARELAEFGITCNAVGPTPIDTDLIRGVPADKIDRIVAMQPLKRLGRCEDVANVVDFFIRPESAYVTGQVIYLGGVS